MHQNLIQFLAQDNNHAQVCEFFAEEVNVYGSAYFEIIQCNMIIVIMHFNSTSANAQKLSLNVDPNPPGHYNVV